MKVLFFANRMPDLCGAFLHDIDLATELLKRGHQVVFLTIQIPKEGFNGGHYRGFRFMHYTAGSSFLETSQLWITPHSPILPDVRKINSRGYHRPIVATCHFDGNYNSVRNMNGSMGAEMLCFVNSIMEANYRKNIAPWPSQIIRTETVYPLMHREKIEILEPFAGDCITLVNANINKGVMHFVEIARRMPDKKFLGVLPYYGERKVPVGTPNIEWVKFDDDIRNILRRTRILLMPSYYESFGRIAVEAMLNRIPVIYSAPAAKSIYDGGSTEGMESWIKPAGISSSREDIDDWIRAIKSLDDDEAYQAKANQSREHIESMNMFNEVSRIAGLLEDFSRQNPVVVRVEQPQAQVKKAEPGRVVLKEPPVGRVGFGLSNGRLKIQR